MQLTLNSLTALRAIRGIRGKALPGSLQRRCDLADPDPSPFMRWTKRRVADAVEPLRPAIAYPARRPLDVLASSAEKRLQTTGVRCTDRTHDYPPGAFVDLGEGLVASGPELVFVELAHVMDPTVHLLLGMELCGRFSRSATDPRNGRVTYNLEPATSVERLRAFAQEAHWVRGAEQALATIDNLVENAWSPMEAIEATGEQNLAEIRRFVGRADLARARRDFIWSLIPGTRAIEVRRRLDMWRRIETHDYEIRFTLLDGSMRILSMREL